MSSNLPKFAYTEKGVVVFSNCLTHEEAVNNVFGEIDITKKGFIEICINEDGKLDFEIFAILSEGKISKVCEKSPAIRKVIHDLLFCVENHAEYVLTFSRFIVFPAQYSHKEIANHLFFDFVIKGAGNMVFNAIDGKPQIETYGESKELKMQASHTDAQILMDGFHIK